MMKTDLSTCIRIWPWEAAIRTFKINYTVI